MFDDDRELGERGAALVESVRQGRRHIELCFRGDSFGSSENLVTFMHALRGDEHLERLHLRTDDHQVTQALAAALHENKGLVRLIVSFGEFDESDITELLKAISLHASLRSRDLKAGPEIYSEIDAQKRRVFTKAVADMLSVNKRVEMMGFHGITLIKTTGMHTFPLDLNATSIGSGFFRSRKSKRRPSVLQSWQESWRSSPANRIWYRCF
jgi:hypothetical protein